MSAAAIERAQVEVRPVVASKALAPAAGQVVLVADDEPAVRNVVQRMLERSGYQVVSAASGREALDLLTQGQTRIDLLLTDLRMPEMSGEQLARAARQLLPQLRVALMTGFTDDGTTREVAPEFDAAILFKPFATQALLDLVGSALADPD